MEPISVKPFPIADFEAAPNMAELLAEYAQESALDELGAANPQFATYRQMEAMGAARMLAAFQGDTLVGFLVVIISVVPHFGKPVASTESFFVAQAARKTGAGLKLLHEAEQIARESGAVGFFVSAPTGSKLADVLDNLKPYRETNRLFFRGLQ